MKQVFDHGPPLPVATVVDEVRTQEACRGETFSTQIWVESRKYDGTVTD
jgi:hypothetical protein